MIFRSAVLPVPDRIAEATERALRHITAPGSWLTGAQRRAIAEAARRALAGDYRSPPELAPALVEAAEAVAVAADEITPEWISDLETRGVDGLTYVELIGVVARMAAIDTFARGVGADLPDLPEPELGQPDRSVADTVAKTVAWVPTDGHAYAPTALKAVRGEFEAQDDLHTAYYLAPARMRDLDISVDGLHRTQMELAAARTSLLNDCFY